MRKLITFLGTGDYKPTLYQWGKREYVTSFFPQAVVAWTKPDEAWFLLTDEAEEHKNWRMAQVMLQGATRVKYKKIPDGRTEDEMWRTFSIINDEIVQENDAVIFDITHGLRSLPVFFLLTVAYLKQLKSIKIEHMLYAAFELADKKTAEAPVFDLTPFVNLLDWLTAAKIFMTTGDGRELAGLIRTISNLPQQQEGLATPFEELSTLLMLNRVPNIPSAARHFTHAVEATAAVELPVQARPLTSILQHISKTYENISKPDDAESEMHLVAWYYDKGHMLQAATLAGEFLVNLVIRATKPDRLSREHARSAVSRTIERFLTGKKPTNEQDKDLEDVRAFLEKFANDHEEAYEKYKSAWSELRDIRNDLAHCGYREKVAKPDEISEKLKTHIDNLSAILDAVRSIRV